MDLFTLITPYYLQVKLKFINDSQELKQLLADLEKLVRDHINSLKIVCTNSALYPSCRRFLIRHPVSFLRQATGFRLNTLPE